MLRKIFHIITDASCLAAITVAGWWVYPALGLFLAGASGLVLHYAMSTGSYTYDDDEVK